MMYQVWRKLALLNQGCVIESCLGSLHGGDYGGESKTQLKLAKSRLHADSTRLAAMVIAGRLLVTILLAACCLSTLAQPAPAQNGTQQSGAALGPVINGTATTFGGPQV